MRNLFTAQTQITINAPKEKVWEAITNPFLVKQYFFGTNLSADWRVGGMIYFRGEYEGKAYEDKGIITAIQEFDLLTYDYKSSWDSSEDIRENYMPIEYKLLENKGLTQLTITQGAFSQEQVNHSIDNWNWVLKGMKDLIESE
jgi:uncharacterized protein YndB with AHSA1/START domain